MCSHENGLNEAILMSAHNIPFLNIKTKIILNYPKSATMRLFPRTREGVRNSRGKQATSVRAIKVLLYYYIIQATFAGPRSAIGRTPDS